MMRRREAAGEWNEASEHARGRDALAPPNGIGRFRACEGGSQHLGLPACLREVWQWTRRRPTIFQHSRAAQAHAMAQERLSASHVVCRCG